jgi:hypothetical protein
MIVRVPVPQPTGDSNSPDRNKAEKLVVQGERRQSAQRVRYLVPVNVRVSAAMTSCHWQSVNEDSEIKSPGGHRGTPRSHSSRTLSIHAVAKLQLSLDEGVDWIRIVSEKTLRRGILR